MYGSLIFPSFKIQVPRTYRYDTIGKLSSFVDYFRKDHEKTGHELENGEQYTVFKKYMFLCTDTLGSK